MESERQPRRDLKFVVSGGLGDCLLATPLLRHLAVSGRYRRVVCAVPRGATEIYDHSPHVDQLIPCSGRDLFLWALPERDAEVFSPYVEVEPAVDAGPEMLLYARPLHSPNPKGVPVLRQLADYFGIHPDDYALEIHTAAEDVLWAERRVTEFERRPFVLINRETPLREKRYPDTRWQKVVDLLRDEFMVVELAAAGTPLKNLRLISPLPGVRASAELLRRAACAVTVESFLGHLSSAVGVPAVVLFGPTNPAVYGHPTNCNLRSSTCAPCADTIRRAACPENVCMASIEPEAIAQAVRDRAMRRSTLDAPNSSVQSDSRVPVVDGSGFEIR